MGIAIAQTVHGTEGAPWGALLVGLSQVPLCEIPQGCPLHLNSSVPFQSPDLMEKVWAARTVERNLDLESEIPGYKSSFCPELSV